MADELRLFAAVLGDRPLQIRSWEREASLGGHDVVCGMPVLGDTHPTAEYAGRAYGFCSTECRDRFLCEPALYV